MFMKRALIVDDEKFIRRGLKVILEQMDYDFSEIQTCRNGREALKILEKDNFDLVLTDVRMPQVDGITLIKQIQQLNHKPEVIMISGYDEFSYAVEGLKYGAQGYILKPIDKKELKEVLDKVDKVIQDKETIKQKDQQLQEYIEQIHTNELNYILMNEHLNKEEIKNRLEAMRLPIFDSPFCVGVLEFCKEHRDEYLIFSQNIIEDYIETHLSNDITFIDKSGAIVILLSKQQHAYDILELISEHVGVKCFLGVSEKSEHMADIRDLYIESFNALQYRIFERESSVLLYDDIKDREAVFSLPIDKIEKMGNMLGVESIAKIHALLWEIFDRDDISKYDISYLEGMVDYIYKNLIVDIFRDIPQKGLELGEHYEKLESIYNFEYIDEYIKEIENYLTDVNEYLTILREAYTGQNQIDMAIQFIQENYHRDLNMAYVANYVSLNYSYFSQVFSKYTGKYFPDYIKEVRIEKAKELLKDTDAKVIDISKKVGFQNSKHFMKSFKEIVGITPTEYRNKANL